MMKNILIITSHPSSKGFTHVLAKRIYKVEKERGNAIEIIDLYKSDFKNSFVTFEEHPKEITIPTHIQEMQEKIRSVDELIVITPMWNLDTPAILKNWFDGVFTARFAFVFTKWGVPKGLLTDKVVKMYITCDAPSWFYKISGNLTKKLWKKWRFGICGMKMKDFKIIGKMRLKSQEEREKLVIKLYP
ncbi:MAG: NAD(P)H-dependent oxidoreductase [Candidatus Woesearchaeota archaeon]